MLHTISGRVYVSCAGGHTCFAATSRLARHDKYTGVYIMHSFSQISESGFRRFGIFACSMGFAGRSVRLWDNYMWRRTPTFVCFYRFQQDISSSLYLYQAAKMYNLCRFTNKLCLGPPPQLDQHQPSYLTLILTPRATPQGGNSRTHFNLT